MTFSIPEEFPFVEDACYLNTAGMGIIPKSVVESTVSLYREHVTAVPYPDMFDKLGKRVERARTAFTGWVGAREEEISFQPNASTSLNFVASMVAPVKGENVVVDDLGFPSGTFPMIALKKRGVEVRWVKSKNGLITARDYEPSIDGKTRLVVVSLVSWINGLRAEVEGITKLAHEKHALCMVDSTHGTGYIDIRADDWKLDFLATSNYKWLLSTHGASEFFCARSLLREFDPPHHGWHTVGGTQVLDAERLEIAETARRFEPGNPDYISVSTLEGSLGVMGRFGRSKVTERTLKLSRMVNEGLRKLGLDVLTPLDDEHLSGITYACSKKLAGAELEKRLRRSKVFVTARGYHGRTGIRVSPYFYNSEEDVGTFLDGMKKIVRAA